MVTSRSVFQHNFGNYNEQIRKESLRNFTSKKANKALENQEFSTTEKLNEIDTAVASSSKQQNKKIKKRKNRSFQTERKEDDEVTYHNHKIDPLNLGFSYFDFRFQKTQNQINKNKEPQEKKAENRSRNIQTKRAQNLFTEQKIDASHNANLICT